MSRNTKKRICCTRCLARPISCSLSLSSCLYLPLLARADVIAAMGAKEIRASSALVGSVQTVKTDRVLFVNPPGEPERWVEDERILTAVTQYGPKGALTERIEYAPDGAVMVRAVRSYNRANRLSTEHLYNSQGALWRQTSHTYDEAGRLTQGGEYRRGWRSLVSRCLYVHRRRTAGPHRSPRPGRELFTPSQL